MGKQMTPKTRIPNNDTAMHINRSTPTQQTHILQQMRVCTSGKRDVQNTGKALPRLIQINWIDIWGVQTIHRFGHQSGPGKRSGGLSTANVHVFPARIFLYGSGHQQLITTNKQTRNKTIGIHFSNQ